jgi:hypothetical protein
VHLVLQPLDGRELHAAGFALADMLFDAMALFVAQFAVNQKDEVFVHRFASFVLCVFHHVSSLQRILCIFQLLPQGLKPHKFRLQAGCPADNRPAPAAKAANL